MLPGGPSLSESRLIGRPPVRSGFGSGKYGLGAVRMFPGIICWSCCWLCCCSRSMATAGQKASNELIPRRRLNVWLREKLGAVEEGWLARLSCGSCVLTRTLKLNVRHGCLCHHEKCRGWRGLWAMEEWRILTITLGIWKERTPESKSQGGGEEIGRKDKAVVCGPQQICTCLKGQACANPTHPPPQSFRLKIHGRK